MVFFNDTATTEIYTLSLHDALPIFVEGAHLAARTAAHGSEELALAVSCVGRRRVLGERARDELDAVREALRSEEHTSELQSRQYLVCRLLLEKKKNKNEHQLTQTFK